MTAAEQLSPSTFFDDPGNLFLATELQAYSSQDMFEEYEQEVDRGNHRLYTILSTYYEWVSTAEVFWDNPQFMAKKEEYLKIIIRNIDEAFDLLQSTHPLPSISIQANGKIIENFSNLSARFHHQTAEMTKQTLTISKQAADRIAKNLNTSASSLEEIMTIQVHTRRLLDYYDQTKLQIIMGEIQPFNSLYLSLVSVFQAHLETYLSQSNHQAI